MSVVLLDVVPASVDAPDGRSWPKARAVVLGDDGGALVLRVFEAKDRTVRRVAEAAINDAAVADARWLVQPTKDRSLDLADDEGTWRIWKPRGCG
jgi:hypothetical protein